LSDSTIQALPDILPIERAARAVAPISDHIEHRYFDGGLFHILDLLGECDIQVEADSEPPRPPYEIAEFPLTRAWFSAIQRHRSGAEYHLVADWNRAYLNWIRASLRVSRAGILANLSSPSGQFHAPIENVDTAGATWSFPQVLAWIATKDPIEVARIQYCQHFGSPMDDAQPGLRAMSQSDSGRRSLIGWLVLQTSLQHCKCGSEVSFDREAWETCQCVGHAYDELRTFAKGNAHPMPEFQPKPAYASFTLTWPVGAHNLRFSRAEILRRWPAEKPTATPANRRLDHDAITSRAGELLAAQPGLSKGSAAASIIAELGNNPKTGRPWDNRHIERMIGHLWMGDLSSPPC
jgi:hypothetical protein